MSQPDDEIARRALAIAAALAAADPGDKAETRRMRPEGSAFFWRQVARLDIPQGREADWLIFARLVALMTPASRIETIHEHTRHLGAVLADGGDRTKALNIPEAKPFLSEFRLARFLATRGPGKHQNLERIIRMLARQKPTFDVRSLANAVMGRSENRLSREYYTRIDQIQTKDTQDA